MADFRTEKDSLGEIKVPSDALWGAQTQRAVQNFPISGMKPYPAFIWAQTAIKRAAAAGQSMNWDCSKTKPTEERTISGGNDRPRHHGRRRRSDRRDSGTIIL